MLEKKIFLFILYTLLLLTLLVFMTLSFVSMGPGSPSSLVIEYRLTRILTAIFAGGILAFTGIVLQTSLRNPLVDHYILGIGSGAVFATYIFYILVDFYGSIQYSLYLQLLFSIAGGLTALFLTITIAEYVGGSDVAYVLAGIGITSIFSGASIVVSYFVVAKRPLAIHSLIGSLVLASKKWLPILAVIYVLSFTLMYILLSKPLNALFLGDDYAHQLGYNPRLTRFIAVVYSGVTSSIVVACCGIIGFIGLVVPHITRFIMKTSDCRYTIPVSLLMGSIMLLSADNFSRLYLVSSIGEVPVGALVSSIGAPFYLVILVRRLRSR